MKNKFLGLVLLLLIFLGCSTKSEKNPYYGIIYRDLNEIPDFKNFQDVGGTIVKDEYTFGLYIDTITSERVITYTDIVRGGEKVKYEIKDLLRIDSLKENQYVSYGNCELNGERNSLIVAIYEYEDKEYYSNIYRAWIIDEDMRMFKEISVEGIKCINEGYYVD